MHTSRALALLMPLSLLTATSTTPGRIAIAPFDAIQLRAGDTIEIQRGPTAVVVTRADPQTLAQLSVETINGVLRIGRKPEACRIPNLCSGSATLKISTPNLSSVVMQGSGSVHGDSVSGRRFAVVMQGSGNVRIDGLQTELADVEMDGSGVVELKGRTERLKISANGRGALDTVGLVAREADVAMNGGGSVRARATNAATISAAGSGSIRVEGTRNCHIVRTGHADIICNGA